jgi:peptidoglycan/LPS O-acetylase OafA/YrhL
MWIGVDIFFVLSGFLITRILIAELDSNGRIGLGRFYARRALRLTPALLAMLIALFSLAAISSNHLGKIAEACALAATYTMNWAIAFHFAWPWTLVHTWSLAIEEQFYLLWPLMLMAAAPRWRVPLVTALLVIVTIWRADLILSGASFDRVYDGFDTHSDGLLIGCLLAQVLPAEGVRSKMLPVAATVVLAALFMFEQSGRGPAVLLYGISLAGLGAGLMVASLQDQNWLSRLLSTRPLVFTGRISYGWYLWHLPVEEIMQHHFPHAPLLFGVVASYLIAVASFFTIERYFLGLKDRLASTGSAPRRSVPLIG